MRVIAGEAKGRPLLAPKGSATRPTADKVKGAMFSMIEALMMAASPDGVARWEGLRVLDLYAGSGALGIEALSRGASWADFVESGSGACGAISGNLARTKLTSRAKVHCVPVRRALSESYLGRLAIPYDIVFMDPPYADPVVPEVLEELGKAMLVKAGGLLVIEHSRRMSLQDSYGPLVLMKSRRHGDTCISLYER